MTPTDATQQGCKRAAEKNAIRPLHVNVSEPEVTELRRRINATKWAAFSSVLFHRRVLAPLAVTPRSLTARAAVLLLAVTVAAGPLLATIAFAQSAKAVRGATPYVEIKNEPPPKLIVDPPLPDLLAQGVVWIQWRVENVNIVPVFGKGALNVSPRVGHLHIHVDDLPWLWADASNINTIDMAGMPPGPHKVLIELVDADHQVFPGQSKTVTFTVPGRAK